MRRLTIREAARRAHRSQDTIRMALATGDLHGHQRVKGGRWFIKAECLEAWMDGTGCCR